MGFGFVFGVHWVRGGVEAKIGGIAAYKGAQAAVPVPLKGEDKSKRAGPANTNGMRTARRKARPPRREPERDCPAAQIASVVFVVFLTFDSLFFFIFRGPRRASHRSGWKFDWSFDQNKYRRLIPRRGRRRRGYPFKARQTREEESGGKTAVRTAEAKEPARRREGPKSEKNDIGRLRKN